VRSPVDWADLDQVERAFLLDAHAAAVAIVTGADLWLFGSRATGTATATSDFDLLLVVPDDTCEALRGRAMGEMSMAARHHGVEAHREVMTASSFADPLPEDRVLTAEVVAYGIKIPSTG
jgi:hypothetical protein